LAAAPTIVSDADCEEPVKLMVICPSAPMVPSETVAFRTVVPEVSVAVVALVRAIV
jgi:hypothetical protein